MRKIALIILAVVNHYTATCQVTKNVIVEHFTNTYCSICASRNPGFYANRVQYPQVIHIAYHPSSPYAACPLNQHNKQENDDRTNYYGIYGATPRLVIQGKALGTGANFNDPAIFQSELGLTSDFNVETSIAASGGAGMVVSVKIKKIASSTLSSLQLYAVLAEDTLFFNAANGETQHYDVFRKSVWGAPINITVPANIGDSVVYTQYLTLNTAWVPNRIYAVALLQNQNKEVIQVAKSANLNSTTAIPAVQPAAAISVIYPSPTKGLITIQVKEAAGVRIFSTAGILLQQRLQNVPDMVYDLSAYPVGAYFIVVTTKNGTTYKNIVKE